MEGITEHTPIPWNATCCAAWTRCSTNSPLSKPSYSLYAPSAGVGTIVGHYKPAMFLTEAEAQANANLIVRAVNNHAKLLAALEASAIERHKDAYPIDNFHALAFEDCRESRCVQARAAIEEAKK